MQAIILTIMLLFWFINYKNASCVRLHFGPHVRLHDFSCYDAVWLFNYDAVMQVLQMQEHAIFCVRWMLVHFTTLHFLRLQSACCFLISKNMQFFICKTTLCYMFETTWKLLEIWYENDSSIDIKSSKRNNLTFCIYFNKLIFPLMIQYHQMKID